MTAVRGGGAGTEAATPAILELLTAAEKSLNEGRCEDYYGTANEPELPQSDREKGASRP